ncbi:class III extradiol dioxygenase subunit B-like domain-containing protein [Actinacidiphila sp. ITFR-21]|uniref:class III extradiol dioxygenase subunit B-like domain-containing protein n=1 Tax=Actinacidiphila sp. ITFR-21 TaxID=3075199 RepID=UPI00288BEB59|nr:class III extradiol dioxygenase subunit B-like domain-containing protein [Streptomyces sp. ITFR-21]WNI18382.1 class III extradiol dioxygenase subunit B-like domain-containing protein [Streptomyces sp. ITFR-21]
MLVAAAVCPCPPLLVPDVAAGAADELDSLRAACADAVGVLAASRPERLVVVGPAEGPARGVFAPGAAGSFRPFGVPLDVTLGEAAQPPPEALTPAYPAAAGSEHTRPPGGGARPGNATPPADVPPTDDVRPLPPSLAVAAWLLRGWSEVPVEGLGVGERLEPERCARTGRALAGSAGRVALLVMGDGSACRTVKAPGYLDERAVPFDAVVAEALAGADTRALAALDPELAETLKVAGRAPWQVLAGAAEGAGLGGELLCETSPYGVGYFVATWT